MRARPAEDLRCPAVLREHGVHLCVSVCVCTYMTGVLVTCSARLWLCL